MAAYKTLLWKEIFEARWRFLIAFLICAVTAFSLPLFFSYAQQLASEISFSGWIEAELLAQISNYDYYLWANWYSKNIFQYLLVLAIIFGAPAVAGEVSRGSMEFMLTRPLSRRALLAVKAASALLMLFVTAVLSTVIAYVSSIWAGYSIHAPFFFAGLPTLLAGVMLLYAIALIFSTVGEDSLKSGLLSFCLIFVFLVPIWIPGLTYFSIWSYMMGLRCWEIGGVDYLGTLLLAALSAAVFYWSVKLFEKRDF